MLQNLYSKYLQKNRHYMDYFKEFYRISSICTEYIIMNVQKLTFCSLSWDAMMSGSRLMALSSSSATEVSLNQANSFSTACSSWSNANRLIGKWAFSSCIYPKWLTVHFKQPEVSTCLLPSASQKNTRLHPQSDSGQQEPAALSRFDQATGGGLPDWRYID